MRFGCDSYSFRAVNGSDVQVEGLQVGKLFVRQALPGEMHEGVRTVGRDAALGWVIDVMGTLISVASYRELATAVMVADDVSRFCIALESVQGDEDAEAALSGPVWDWVLYACDKDERGLKPEPFRDWLHGRARDGGGYEMEVGGP